MLTLRTLMRAPVAMLSVVAAGSSNWLQRVRRGASCEAQDRFGNLLMNPPRPGMRWVRLIIELSLGRPGTFTAAGRLVPRQHK